MSTTARYVTIYRVIEAQAYKMTKIVGGITPEKVDELEEDAREINTTSKSAHFPQVGEYLDTYR